MVFQLAKYLNQHLNLKAASLSVAGMGASYLFLYTNTVFLPVSISNRVASVLIFNPQRACARGLQ